MAGGMPALGAMRSLCTAERAPVEQQSLQRPWSLGQRRLVESQTLERRKSRESELGREDVPIRRNTVTTVGMQWRKDTNLSSSFLLGRLPPPHPPRHALHPKQSQLTSLTLKLHNVVRWLLSLGHRDGGSTVTPDRRKGDRKESGLFSGGRLPQRPRHFQPLRPAPVSQTLWLISSSSQCDKMGRRGVGRRGEGENSFEQADSPQELTSASRSNISRARVKGTIPKTVVLGGSHMVYHRRGTSL